MFRKARGNPARKHLVIERDDVLFVTPVGSSRMFANVIVVRDGEGGLVFIDASSHRDPGVEFIEHVLQKKGLLVRKGTGARTHVLFTHHHVDHTSGLNSLRQAFPDLVLVAPEGECWHIQHPYNMPRGWQRLNEAMAQPPAVIPLYRVLMKGIGPLYSGVPRWVNRVHASFPETAGTIKLGGRKFMPIFTPGHSPAHCAYLDETGVLFLGDVVPGTPWLHPEPGMLDKMLESIERLIRLPEDRVEYSVRSHCNASDHGNFIYPWPEERDRFRRYLALILATLDRLPGLLRGRELTPVDVAHLVINKYRNYSKLMNKIWVP
ncbi:MAG: MBL fold metallo-hydrolase, partial [Promethearchaeota archaeon]